MKLCNDKDFDEMKTKYRQLLEARFQKIADLTHEKYWAEERELAAYNDLIECLS